MEQDIKKKKLIQINTVCNGSTGKIMGQIQLDANKRGYETISFYGRRKGYANLKCERFGSFFSFWLHVIWTTITDRHGCASWYYTKKMIKRLRQEKPDIIHLHNIHGYYLNYPMLFRYLKGEFAGEIVWTFHDCWPITGHCPYFVMANCERWENMCFDCPNKKLYPISWIMDSSRRNYKLKKELFCGLDKLTIVCPSQWLADIVHKSYFTDNKIMVISNGIDFKMFYPRKNKEIVKKYGVPQNKKIILGVASIWEARKGLDVFSELAKRLDEKYIIVLVGLSKKQISNLDSRIIGIERTENQDELAQLYSAASVFLNPSEEETFSLVTVEAMACGTPVIALDSSAVKELVKGKTGIILHKPIMEDYLIAIEKIMSGFYDKEEIQKSVRRYSTENMTQRYMEIYG